MVCPNPDTRPRNPDGLPEPEPGCKDDGVQLPVTIELPHVGESVVEGTIGKWLKQPGDTVRRYEPLVEVVTDKVTMEVPSPVAGSLLRLLAQEGETLPMGAPIAEVDAADGPGAPPPSAASPAQAAPPAPATATPSPSAPSAADARPPGTVGYLLRDVTPVGPTGGAAIEAAEPLVGVEAVAQAAAAPTPSTPTPASPAPAVSPASADAPPMYPQRLSPAVRRLAREHSVDLTRISGSGMGGRITRDDVLNYVAQRSAPPPAAAPPEAIAPQTDAAAIAPPPQTEIAAPQTPSASPGADEERRPVSPVRRMIAEAMVRSVSQIPHAWSAVEVDVSGLVARRRSLRDRFQAQEGVPLTYLPFVIQAVVEGLRRYPTLNASWGGDHIVLKRRINLGLAVAAANGLVVPVIPDADRLSLAGLARAVYDLSERARANRLTLGDVQGGTFTLNNTGALGSYVSGPIINHPQAGIITTEAIGKRPVVVNDAIAIRSMMNLCLSFDHRINDGAEASGFLAVVKQRLESIGPDTPAA